MHIKQKMVVGASVLTVAASSLGAVGVASADSGSSSLSDQIASKFHVSKTDAQAVIDAHRAEHHAKHEAADKTKLADAVKAGKLTQDQADHISGVIAEVQQLRGATKPKDLSADTRSQIKSKLQALRTWAKDNKVPMKYIHLARTDR